MKRPLLFLQVITQNHLIPAHTKYQHSHKTQHNTEAITKHRRNPKKRYGAALWISITAGFLICMLLGALFTAYILFPALQNQYGNDNNGGIFPAPSETPAPAESEQPSSTGMPDEYEPDEEIGEIGGARPIIKNPYNPVPEIAEALSDSIVGVLAKVTQEGELEPISRGTGFIIHENGYVMTNYHVVSGAEQCYVTFGEEEVEAKYVGGDASMDLAILKIEKSGLKAVAIGNSDETRVGEMAIAMGNPSGAGENLVGTVTVGYISAVQREIMFNGTKQTFIQTDAAVNPGNSGGPLLNDKGEVIGVVTLKSLVSSVDTSGNPITTEGIGFAIPISKAAAAAVEIIHNGSIKRPGIGIEFRSVTKEEIENGLPAYGKVVANFMKNSTAEAAGLKLEDVIIDCNGISLEENETALVDAVASAEIGDKITLQVWRNGSELEIVIEVGDINQM
ncbi:MAG: S1C family serine protease [Christensenellaceae bacterium]